MDPLQCMGTHGTQGTVEFGSSWGTPASSISGC